jgi:hypothetical protein
MRVRYPPRMAALLFDESLDAVEAGVKREVRGGRRDFRRGTLEGLYAGMWAA